MHHASVANLFSSLQGSLPVFIRSWFPLASDASRRHSASPAAASICHGR